MPSGVTLMSWASNGMFRSAFMYVHNTTSGSTSTIHPIAQTG